MNKMTGLVVIALVAMGIGVAVYAFEPFESEPEVTPPISNLRGGFHDTPEECVLNTTLPSVPDKLMVYKVVEPNVTREEATSLAEQFGVNGSLRERPRGFVARDGPCVLSIADVIVYINESKTPEWVVESEKDRPEGVPSDEEAIEIATKFLNEKGLMPEDAVLRGAVPQTLLLYIPPNRSDSGEKEIISLWKGAEVWFGREINGYPVTGSKMSVEVDGYGKVIDLFMAWSECEPYKEYPIITPEEAFEEFKREGIDVCLRNVSTATINSVYLAYYSECAPEKQTYLQPVYVFEGEAEGCRGDHDETKHFKKYVVAVPEMGGIEFPRLRC